MQNSLLKAHLDPRLTLERVELSVSNLERSLNFYQTVLGMMVLERDASGASLGTPTHTLLRLLEISGTPLAPQNSPGLFHFAVLLPTRADLARWVRHASSLWVRIGQGDHLVSEAFYLSDPDEHGIEVYWDRPRDTWVWQGGEVQMATNTVDVDGLMREPGAQLEWTGLPEGAVLGHFHLRVSDLEQTKQFYLGVLGFDLVGRYPGALFISVGGYHHHFGLNVWQSQGGKPASAGSARLLRANVKLSSASELEQLEGRLSAAGVNFARGKGSLEVADPSGNLLRFTV